MQLWLVTQVKWNPDIEGAVIWEFQGIFSSEEKALAACRDENYTMAPAILDEELPHESLPDWPGFRAPKREA